jgi:stage III sporulation protein SpoIIIAA
VLLAAYLSMQVLMEVVQNHNPQVIIVDEIGTAAVRHSLHYALHHVVHA